MIEVMLSDFLLLLFWGVFLPLAFGWVFWLLTDPRLWSSK
jgi:hypothetical protein